MYIVPYTYKKQIIHDRMFHIINILTDGGSRIWTENDDLSIETDILEANGLVATRIEKKETGVYITVDDTRTDMESMYKWKELPAKTDMLCWRQFTLISDKDGNAWIEIPESPFRSSLTYISRV